jgi:hypothetical protein
MQKKKVEFYNRIIEGGKNVKILFAVSGEENDISADMLVVGSTGSNLKQIISIRSSILDMCIFQRKHNMKSE